MFVVIYQFKYNKFTESINHSIEPGAKYNSRDSMPTVQCSGINTAVWLRILAEKHCIKSSFPIYGNTSSFE